MLYVIDAHALLWHLAGSPRLSARARRIMQDPEAELVLPAIALAEICWAVERGKIPGVTIIAVFEALNADARVRVAPLDRRIVERTVGLSAVHELHDRQIVATALELADAGERVSLVTADLDIAASGLVDIVW